MDVDGGCAAIAPIVTFAIGVVVVMDVHLTPIVRRDDVTPVRRRLVVLPVAFNWIGIGVVVLPMAFDRIGIGDVRLTVVTFR